MLFGRTSNLFDDFFGDERYTVRRISAVIFVGNFPNDGLAVVGGRGVFDETAVCKGADFFRHFTLSLKILLKSSSVFCVRL